MVDSKIDPIDWGKLCQRVENTERWVKDIDEKLDAFLKDRRCDEHSGQIKRNIKMIEDQGRRIDKLLIGGLVGMVGIITCLIAIILQNAGIAP